MSDQAITIARKIIDCFERGGKVMVMGNGGSATQASHFAGEFVGKYLHNRIALPAISLTADQAIITAVANDFGYKYVFTRQIEALGKRGDLLISLSTSGLSENCLAALDLAKQMKIETIDFPRKGDSTPTIQEYQVKLMHKICKLVEEEYL